jgi:hypothetical protein
VFGTGVLYFEVISGTSKENFFLLLCLFRRHFLLEEEEGGRVECAEGGGQEDAEDEGLPWDGTAQGRHRWRCLREGRGNGRKRIGENFLQDRYVARITVSLTLLGIRPHELNYY